ncbi:MAG: single-stranded-DNA-specific exonuclease RecJ [Rickettsiaceae bacterium]|nr:single-stranded-DNA-specific exonuclease RecJ [Rickettsiaceae bacterium]
MIKSVSGKKWIKKHLDERLVEQIVQSHDLPEFLSRILVSRGINVDQVTSFLNPKLRDLLPDPFHLKDMDKGGARILAAIENSESIYILGDYDVDGATSSALLKRFFRDIGVDAKIFIPDRIIDGYGPSKAVLERLKKAGADVVITVDCGAVAFEPLKYASEIGLDVIVIDHHMGGEEIPEGVAIINPNRLDETTEYKYLAAVGVSFLFVTAISSLLKKAGYFTKKSINLDLLSYLDLVALGTVCDVMPLIGLNRALVCQGLKIMSRRNNHGLKILSDMSRLEGVPTCYHLGFVIGPRINAGGRVGKSDLGAILLSTTSEEEAYKIFWELERHNDERKAIEAEMLEDAMNEAYSQADRSVIMVAREGWHPGVIGIIAGRIKEKFQKPTAVIAINNGIGKASCRSVKGVNFGAKIVEAKMNGIIEEGGGHAMAAGFSVKGSKISELHNFLCEKIMDEYIDFAENHCHKYDIEITTSGATLTLVKQLQKLAPFGSGNYEPIVRIDDLFVLKADLVGEKHISVLLAPDRNAYGSKAIKAIAFNSYDTQIGKVLLSPSANRISVLGNLQINSWQDRENLQIIIHDLLST